MMTLSTPLPRNREGGGRRQPHRRGGTLILTMIFLAVFTSLALSFTAACNLNLRQAGGYQAAQNAQFAAESGKEYMIAVLAGLVVPTEEAEADMLMAVADHLAALIDDTANMGTNGISYADSTVSTPVVPLGGDGHTFEAAITPAPGDQLYLTITGRWGRATRNIRITLEPDNTTSAVFDYGIASKGKIILAGDGTILGANSSDEACILSATYTDLEAVSITGNCTVAGDISTSNPDSTISITGHPEIGGTSDKTEIEEFLHIGVGDPVFPEIDISPYEHLATNIYDPATDTGSDVILENIRIPAGTNPNFTAGVQIRGVLLIEEPNDVKFAGHADITGVIITEDPGDMSFYDNTITFSGTVTSQGVESLPEEPQFTELKQLPGTMLLAPGFGVTFTGNFNTINGAIAADKFSITGNAGGVICGPIISYGDTEFELLGSSEVVIDRSQYGTTPIGFKLPVRLVPVANTYLEM